jgi:hypothetical protein
MGSFGRKNMFIVNRRRIFIAYEYESN